MIKFIWRELALGVFIWVTPNSVFAEIVIYEIRSLLLLLRRTRKVLIVVREKRCARYV